MSGGEAKSLPYLLGQMNLLLHGVESPEVDPLNSLRFPLLSMTDADRVDVVLTNPPFGGEEERGILANFPPDMQSTETALLFLQLVMEKLRRQPNPGRAGIVVPDGILAARDGVPERVKRHLLTHYNLHTVVRMPPGVFEPYTPIPSNLLFFDRAGPTADVWFYDHPLPDGRKKYVKTAPIRYDEFAPCRAWWNTRTATDRAWSVPAAELLEDGTYLDRRHPGRRLEDYSCQLEALVSGTLKSMQGLGAEATAVLDPERWRIATTGLPDQGFCTALAAALKSVR